MWCARTLYGHAEKVLSVAVLEAFVVKGAWFGGVVLGLAVFVFVLILHFYWVQFGVLLTSLTYVLAGATAPARFAVPAWTTTSRGFRATGILAGGATGILAGGATGSLVAVFL